MSIIHFGTYFVCIQRSWHCFLYHIHNIEPFSFKAHPPVDIYDEHCKNHDKVIKKMVIVIVRLVIPFAYPFPFYNISWGQFHQRFTRSFYAHRSKKRKNTDDFTVFFVLSSSAPVKTASRMLMKLTPDLIFLF